MVAVTVTLALTVTVTVTVTYCGGHTVEHFTGTFWHFMGQHFMQIIWEPPVLF